MMYGFGFGIFLMVSCFSFFRFGSCIVCHIMGGMGFMDVVCLGIYQHIQRTAEQIQILNLFEFRLQTDLMVSSRLQNQKSRLHNSKENQGENLCKEGDPGSSRSAPLHLCLLSLSRGCCCCCCRPADPLALLRARSGVSLPFFLTDEAGDETADPDPDPASGRRHPPSSVSWTSTIPRLTVIGTADDDELAEGCWMMKRSARIFAASSGSPGARSLDKKRRRAWGRVCSS